jgi:hypothetical protein
LTIANPDSFEASLFLRIAATPKADDRWVTSISVPRPVDWDRLTAFALLENAVTLLDERVSRLSGRSSSSCWNGVSTNPCAPFRTLEST